MGRIEINDGITNRRIALPDLPGTVRIELNNGECPSVIVPETFDLGRRVNDGHQGVSEPPIQVGER